MGDYSITFGIQEGRKVIESNVLINQVRKEIEKVLQYNEPYILYEDSTLPDHTVGEFHWHPYFDHVAGKLTADRCVLLNIPQIANPAIGIVEVLAHEMIHLMQCDSRKIHMRWGTRDWKWCQKIVDQLQYHNFDKYHQIYCQLPWEMEAFWGSFEVTRKVLANMGMDISDIKLQEYWKSKGIVGFNIYITKVVDRAQRYYNQIMKDWNSL